MILIINKYFYYIINFTKKNNITNIKINTIPILIADFNELNKNFDVPISI